MTYESYNYDRWHEAVPSQAGYIAEYSVSGRDLGTEDFNNISDIFYACNDIFYIADSGNNRIVAIDSDFDSVIGIYDKFTMPDNSETTLKNPTGIYISAENNCMYIADNGNSRVLVSDLNGSITKEITKPDSEIYNQDKTFLPQKVIADKTGNIYVVLNNITTGAAMFSPEGDFTGFYGANRIEPTAQIIRNYFADIFVSDEKKSRRTRNIPTGITSFDIDGDFIFTCTSSSSQKTDTVKKLNAAGDNIFSASELTFGDYAPMYDTSQNKLLAPAIIDIDISEDGNINCLDFTTGRIFQYDKDCNLLFITGNSSDQLGGFKNVSAVESMDDKLYVTDSMKNTVTVFRETDFGKIVHEASELYNSGYYEEALHPWKEVLKYDGNYRQAYIGVASGYLRKGDYKNSMKYAKLADDSDIYNKAFEGWRNDFVKSNFRKILLIVFTAVFFSVSFRRFRHRRKNND
ncbi:MAG: hypothetical protein K2G83_04260 [Ruminococcus sp.]|nr:hypothetical protein [Ruminococcus sp.]